MGQGFGSKAESSGGPPARYGWIAKARGDLGGASLKCAEGAIQRVVSRMILQHRDRWNTATQPRVGMRAWACFSLRSDGTNDKDFLIVARLGGPEATAPAYAWWTVTTLHAFLPSCWFVRVNAQFRSWRKVKGSTRSSEASSDSTVPLSDDTAATVPIDRSTLLISQRSGPIPESSMNNLRRANLLPSQNVPMSEETANEDDATRTKHAENAERLVPCELSDIDSLIDGDSWNEMSTFAKSKDVETNRQRTKSHAKEEARYTKFIEDRLQYLEQWIKDRQDSSKDENELFSEPGDQTRENTKYAWSAEDFSDDHANPSWTMEQLVDYYEPDVHPKVNRAFRDDLRLFHGSKFAIDVPMEDPDAGNETHVWPAYTKRRDLKKSSMHSKAKRSLPNVGSHRLGKVRINSNPIRRALLQLPKVHLTDPIIIAPFKTLLCNEDKIRAHLHDLERLANFNPDFAFESNHGSQACSVDLKERDSGLELEGYTSRLSQIDEELNSPTTEINPHFEIMKDIAKARVTLPHWRCLIELLDRDFKYLSDLRQEIKQGSLQNVVFEDTWHLFSPGDLIITNETGHLQALRVLSVTGGRRLIDARVKEGDWGEAKGPTMYTEDWLNPHESTDHFSPLVVNCYHLDFNGHHFGPVQVDQKIEPYTGTKPVTKLPIYPAQFLERIPRSELSPSTGPNAGISGSKMLNELQKRGQRFCKLCPDVDQVCHMQYQGMTLDEVPDLIDSPIIIDPREAYLQNPKGTSVAEPWTPFLGLGLNEKPDSREWCEPATSVFRACAKPQCTLCKDKYDLRYVKYEDFGVEEIRAREFMMDKPLLTEKKGVKSLSDEDTERDIMTLPPRLFAFALRDRKWIQADIDRISDLRVDDKKFEKLVLPEGHAKIVRSLVETHLGRVRNGIAKSCDSAYHSDIVQGKGTGLILLLHGAPGVGKTSTAECIAELTRRPLFPITCGDIGDNATDVQRNLEQNFHLAHHWNCVLLLDEADVFLAQRERTDLKRNALVSVFLRVLEYYRGILFLTTNRVGSFDEAFKSRIHLSLHYPPLDRQSTIKVWEMNLKEAAKRGLDVDERQIKKFAKKHAKRHCRLTDDSENQPNSVAGSCAWNGRQIRNAFQTAIALAVWESQNATREDTRSSEQNNKKIVLRREHFEQVKDASDKFEEYLINVRGGDDAELAQVYGIRDDSLKPSLSSPWSPRQSQSLPTGTKKKKKPKGIESDDCSNEAGGWRKKNSSKSKGRGNSERRKKSEKALRDEGSSESESEAMRTPKVGRGKSFRQHVSDPDSSSSSSEGE